MTTKKIFGYVLILIALVLTLAIVGQLPELFGAVYGFLKIFTGQLESYQVGQAIGQSVYWLFHFALTIWLWIKGVNWTKKETRDVNENSDNH